MASSQAGHDAVWNQSAASLRSRASSVVSTGTKISISTLPQEDSQHFEAVSALPNSRINTRRHSLLSITSHEQPAPPYEHEQTLDGPYYASYRHGSAFGGHMPSSAMDNFYARPGSPPTDSENALSMHYGRVVRTIDENQAQEIQRLTQAHEAELAAARQETQRQAQKHEKDLAATRHEIDHAYRKVLQAKTREVERFREEANARVALVEAELQRLVATHEDTVGRMQADTDEQLATLADAHEVAIDKARNAVEDLWEGRWSDRARLAAEEARLIGLQRQRDLEHAVADRDQEWVRELGNRHPELVAELRDAIGDLGGGEVRK